MKYFKLNDVIYAFESDGSQDEYIKADMLEMTQEEIDRHLNPANYLSEAEKQALHRASLSPLTRRQFKLVLLNHGLVDDIDAAIASIEDVEARRYIEIEYQESTHFERLSVSVSRITQLLNLTDEQVDEMWEVGLTL